MIARIKLNGPRPGDVFFPESGAVIVFEYWVTVDRTIARVLQLQAAAEGRLLPGSQMCSLDKKWFATCDCRGSIAGICAGLAALARPRAQDPVSLRQALEWCDDLLARDHGTERHMSSYAEAYGYLSQGVRMYLAGALTEQEAP